MSLKEQTQDLHEEAEKSKFAQLLLSGNITEKQYATYIANLLPIYEAIEEFDGDYEEEELRLYRIKFFSEVAN